MHRWCFALWETMSNGVTLYRNVALRPHYMAYSFGETEEIYRQWWAILSKEILNRLITSECTGEFITSPREHLLLLKQISLLSILVMLNSLFEQTLFRHHLHHRHARIRLFYIITLFCRCVVLFWTILSPPFKQRKPPFNFCLLCCYLKAKRDKTIPISVQIWFYERPG